MNNEAFLALLEKLGSEQTAQDDFYRILSGIRDHIRDLPEIRIYVDNSLTQTPTPSLPKINWLSCFRELT